MSALVLTLARVSYQVTITLPRPQDDDAPVPPGAQVLAEAAAVGAGGLMTAWTPCEWCCRYGEGPVRGGRNLAGRAVARALGGGDAAAVEAEPASW
jgi:hypothetical protein